MNLNVAFPASVLKGNLKGLPVMAYIHGNDFISIFFLSRLSWRLGGSFKQGSANEPRHDGWGFVDISIQIGRPVVYVGIKFIPIPLPLIDLVTVLVILDSFHQK